MGQKPSYCAGCWGCPTTTGRAQPSYKTWTCREYPTTWTIPTNLNPTHPYTAPYFSLDRGPSLEGCNILSIAGGWSGESLPSISWVAGSFERTDVFFVWLGRMRHTILSTDLTVAPRRCSQQGRQRGSRLGGEGRLQPGPPGGDLKSDDGNVHPEITKLDHYYPKPILSITPNIVGCYVSWGSGWSFVGATSSLSKNACLSWLHMIACYSLTIY